MKIDQVLTYLGLQDKEPDVFLALLRTPGVQPASVIAHRANLNRSTTYKALINLSKSGLIAKTQLHGVTCFFVEDPERRLKTLVDRQKKKIENMNQFILEKLPLLAVTEEESANLPKIRYYDGIEGVKQIYEAVLKTGKDVYRYGDITKIYDALGPFTDEYIKERNFAGIVTHAIMPFHETDRKTLKKHQKENRKVLLIPHKHFPINGEIRIFGNHVAIISLQKESPIAVLIESETISKMFLSIFMLTWKQYACKVVDL